ncbi:hypothetical protein L3Q82_006332 [Scortum barcoo]|uniref:Uncharacterized protein n=1 Tax=Scortum barcoo TaxID=214431 RepID=A0ACB8X3H3_9TELE|nr:hypothetical protein L3Q82_006332 [Scortum barcoo]
MAPVLTTPDPKLQFIVEVDTSNEGVGAILSQRFSKDNQIHPCAFLSRKLSSAEKNYNVGNRELLAIKVTLEEWRHWLEGAEQPFIVWTDHKNLEYLKSAKQLNSRQVGFSRFRFTLFYRPESHAKPDALSHLYEPEPAAKEPKSILPPVWTVFVVKQQFWWPSLAKDVAEYVVACSICARSKVSRQAQMGLLQPLLVPHRPCSHLSLDFVTGLPLSKDIIRGPQFISGFWKEFCQLICAIVSLFNGYHPESNGQTERLNQSEHLTWVEYAQVNHRYQPPLFPANEEEVTVHSAHALARRCRKVWAAAQQMLLWGQARMKTAADLHRPTHLAKKFGYPPKTCHFMSTLRS